MDMTGERRIPAPRLKVWTALNDPAVLKSCIPGCESLEKTSDTDMKATASVKIGPISARFSGKVQLLDLDPPNGYRIDGEGQGGVAGFAKGGATVTLAEDGAVTVLSYVVKAQVGGKIAQLGARLIDATAKQMADAFFNRFVTVVSDTPAAPALPVLETVAPDAAPFAATPVAATPVAATPVAATPVETGASGLAGAVAAATGDHPAPPVPASAPLPAPPQIRLLSLIPSEPFGMPIVFWLGGAVWLVIFVLIFGSYL